MLKITIDTNLWQKVVMPNDYSEESGFDSFKTINQAIAGGKILGTLAETLFTIENIQKKRRQKFFSDYKPKVQFKEDELPDGTINLSFSMRPDKTAPSGGNNKLLEYWAYAEKLGFKILHCPRIAAPTNPDLKAEWFINTTHAIVDRFGACDREIASNGCGISQLIKICKKYASATQVWHEGFALSPESEESNIAKAVAEWADGDTIATHYAYENDYICTRDIAKSGGADSVFSSKNRAWLESKYDVKFITPEQLAATI